MKKLAIIASLLAISTAAWAANPLVTYNDAYYKDGKFALQHMDKQVAVEGVVTQIKDGPEGRPILQLDLTGNVDKKLWVGSLTDNKDEIKIGDKLRVMGFFDKTVMETEYMSKISKDLEYLLGMCFYDVGSKRPMFFHKWMKECMAWEEGTLKDKISK
jgi:hypothetical protein